MNILLIAPSSGHWKGLGKKTFFNGKTFRFSMLSLLTVAALTPDQHRIKIIDEQVDPIPDDEHFDLVGITMMTATAPRAYELCRNFREKSIATVVGGFHPTFNIEEALKHADAVVIGPAAEAWPRLLADLKAGNLQKIYHGNPAAAMPTHLPKHLLKESAYLSVNTTYATLGCRNECSFCSITSFYGGQRYRRPVNEVVSELSSFDERFFMFIDDNLTQDREYCLELLDALIPLKKKWVTQASVEISDDPELLYQLAASGCVGVFIGLESFSDSALCSQNKTIKSAQYYKDAVKKLHDYGIFVEAGLIFGFDTDSVEVFQSTLKILDEIGMDAMQASILTPLPGTKLFKQMKDQIVDFNWEHYDYKYAVFDPANMSRTDLQAGLEWINKRFYSPGRILKRIIRWLTMPTGIRNLYFPLFLNVAYWGRQFQFKVKGYNPAKFNKIQTMEPEKDNHPPVILNKA